MTVAAEHKSSALYSNMIDEIRSASLTSAEVAEITGVKTRQVQNWASGASRPQSEVRDRLLELYYLVEKLMDIYKPEGIDIWIHGRSRQLNGDRPIDLLRDGQFERVLAAVERLETGAM